MLNFGKVASQTQHICFDAPVPSIPTVAIPSISIPSITTPKLPNVSVNTSLGFGVKIPSVSSAVPTFKLGLPDVSGKLTFGLPSLSDFNSKLASIKIPTTVCISIGGTNTDLSSIFNQINSALTSLSIPTVNIPLPNLSDLNFSPISNLVPALNVNPKLNINISTDQILSQIKERCSLLSLNAFDSLDPLEALSQLAEQLSQLCGSSQFEQMQAIITKIENAKVRLVQSLIDQITDPVEKLDKLFSMATDAIQAGAQDILQEVSNQIDRVKFDALITQIMNMNPTAALAALSNEIQQQAQLGNISSVQQLLTGISIVQSQLQQAQTVAAAVLNQPNNILSSIQNQINQAAQLQDFEQIQKLVSSYSSYQSSLIQALGNLDVSSILSQGEAMLQQALQNLDLSSYNAILDQMAATICNEASSILPSTASNSSINPSAVPNFLQ
jgi:hypothetical protein